jgi:hypothetical protein
MTFTSPSETRFRSLRLGLAPCFTLCRSTTVTELDSLLPLLGIPKITPPPSLLVRPLRERLPKKVRRRREAATLRTRSVLAVSHDLDGLSRTCPAGLLHPATGPGVRHDSSGCRLTLAVVASDGMQCLRASHLSQWRSCPSECSPRQQLLSRHRDRCLLAVCRTQSHIRAWAQAP